MKQSEKLEIVGCTLGIFAIVTLVQSPLLNTIAVAMGVTMLFRLGSIFKKNPTVAGVYVSSDRTVYVSKVEQSQSNPIQVEAVGSSSGDYESFVGDVLANTRKGYGRWQRPKIFYCPALGTPHLSADFFNAQASRLGVGIYSADPRMCAAIGAGVNVTDSSKQIVILCCNDAVYSFIVFAANIFHGDSIHIHGDCDWQEILEDHIARLRSITEPDLPPHYKTLKLDPKEYQQMFDGWLQPCGEIHVIGPPNAVEAARQLNPKIITANGVDETIASGLAVMTKEISELAPGTKIGQRA